MKEHKCPVTGYVCRTDWCLNTNDCAQYHSFLVNPVLQTIQPSDHLPVMDVVAMAVIEGWNL